MESELDPVALSSLDTDRTPGPELEERVVQALYEQDLLRAARLSSRTPSAPIARHRSRQMRAAWLAGTVAAGLAFAAGVRVGQVRVPPRVTPVVAGAQSRDPAARVRRAAFDYITALSAVRAGDIAARTASTGTFHAVASQMIRLAPESDIGFAIRTALPTSFALSPAAVATTTSPKRVIWF